MEKAFSLCVGFLYGIAFFAIGSNVFRPAQETTITIQTVGCGPLSDLKSNRLHDGDSFLVILDGDTLHNAIVENGEFVKPYRVAPDQPAFKKSNAPVDKNWIIDNNGAK